MDNKKDIYTREEALKAIMSLEKKKRKKNFISLISSFIGSIIIAVAISSIFSATTNLFSKDGKTKDNQSIQLKISELDNVKSSLTNLSDFLEEQKAIIVEQQLMIEKLQKKNKELEPIVNSNQETVDAILLEADNSAAKRIWKERFIGILFGVISSLIATYLWRLLIKKK